jgi:hypothetical protein
MIFSIGTALAFVSMLPILLAYASQVYPLAIDYNRVSDICSAIAGCSISLGGIIGPLIST